MKPDGIIIINKPQQFTSHDVVNVVRKKLGIKKVGHTGTLDPMATGVLPVCVGKATRIMDYLDLDLKTYRCTLQLGQITDTQDIWGEVLESRSFSSVSEEDIEEAVMSFRGEVEQIPPKYSALKVNGRKLYEYAREGREVEIKSRKIFVDSMEIHGINQEAGEVDFSVRCSKGTYIRTICKDIGEKLGCGGTMKSLVRTATGVFSLEEAIDIDTFRELDLEDIDAAMYAPEYPLINFGKGSVDKYGKKWFINGGDLSLNRVQIMKKPRYKDQEPPFKVKDEYRRMYNIYSRDEEEFLGTACYNTEKEMYIPDKIFYRG